MTGFLELRSGISYMLNVTIIPLWLGRRNLVCKICVQRLKAMLALEYKKFSVMRSTPCTLDATYHTVINIIATVFDFLFSHF
jgi:hypothetical protein